MRLLALLLLLLPVPALALDRTISVSGECHHKVTPDRGALTVTAEFRDMDLRAASRKATEAYEKVRDQVKRLNLESVELRTSEYTLSEVNEWESTGSGHGRNVFKGYRARMGLFVGTTQISRLGEVIELAAREGLKDVGSLQTMLSDDKKAKEHFACLQEAATNARAKAEKLAGALGAKVGPVAQLSETSYEPPRFPRPEMAMLSAAADGGRMAKAAAPSVEAGEVAMNVTISAVFSIQ